MWRVACSGRREPSPLHGLWLGGNRRSTRGLGGSLRPARAAPARTPARGDSGGWNPRAGTAPWAARARLARHRSRSGGRPSRGLPRSLGAPSHRGRAVPRRPGRAGHHRSTRKRGGGRLARAVVRRRSPLARARASRGAARRTRAGAAMARPRRSYPRRSAEPGRPPGAGRRGAVVPLRSAAPSRALHADPDS